MREESYDNKGMVSSSNRVVPLSALERSLFSVFFVLAVSIAIVNMSRANPLGESRSSCDMNPIGESLPVTEFVDPPTNAFPTSEQVQLIGRLAEGIHNWKTRREHGWWECGEFTETGPDTEDRAILLAYELVKAAAHFSDDSRDVEDSFTLNVWGLAATIAHESSFDRCAVGYYFRKWAIQKKLLKSRTRTISYGEKELLDAMNSPHAKRWFSSTGVDVGYCQLLTRFHEGNKEELMHPVKGIHICAKHFQIRGKQAGTSRPWKWWRGYKAKWYDAKITRRALALGAQKGEI